MERRRPLSTENELPKALEVNFAGVPEILQERPQWVVWQYARVEDEIKKPPFSPRTGKLASVTRPDTWGSFTQAQKAYETRTITGKSLAVAGVGFVLTTGIVGIDLDHCIHEGRVSDEAQEIIRALATYTEYSPSQTGVHLLMHGSLPGPYRRSGTIEMYQDGRYLTVTGHRISDTPPALAHNQEQLTAVYRRIFPSPTT